MNATFITQTRNAGTLASPDECCLRTPEYIYQQTARAGAALYVYDQRRFLPPLATTYVRRVRRSLASRLVLLRDLMSRRARADKKHTHKP